MVCSGLDPTVHNTIIELLKFPLSCDYYFYAKIVGGIWAILTFILFFLDRDKLGRGEMLSSMAISSFATIVIALAGTPLGIITADIMILTFVLGMIPIVIWLIKG